MEGWRTDLSGENLLTPHTIFEIADLLVEAAWTRTIPGHLVSYLRDLEARGSQWAPLHELLMLITNELVRQGPWSTPYDTKPSLRLYVRELLTKRLNELASKRAAELSNIQERINRLTKVVSWPRKLLEATQPATSESPSRAVDPATCRGPIPGRITDMQRKAIVGLLHLWRTGQLPTHIHIILGAVRQEAPCGELVAMFFEDVIVELHNGVRERCGLTTDDEFEGYLKDGIEVILAPLRLRVRTLPRIVEKRIASTSETKGWESDTVRSTHVSAIVTTLSDYRLHEIPRITPEHVERWVRQFASDDQMVILSEMDRILSRYYVSRAKAEGLLETMLSHKEIFGEAPGSAMAYTEFLEIQIRGESQRDLLALASNLMWTRYGMHLSRPTTPRQYVYLDDCLFSGNHAYRDMEAWIPTAKEGTVLHVILLGAHSNGIRYFEKRMAELSCTYGIEIKIWPALVRTFQNDYWDAEEYDCLWPERVSKDAHVDEFARYVEETAQEKRKPARLFRPAKTSSREEIFSSAAARAVVERAFLKAGAYICSLPTSRQPNMRPMGYEILQSLGFGAVFTTYRNIANNCPLALWWGDPAAGPGNPLSKWQPLLPRKVNHPSSFVIARDGLDDIDEVEAPF